MEDATPYRPQGAEREAPGCNPACAEIIALDARRPGRLAVTHGGSRAKPHPELLSGAKTQERSLRDRRRRVMCARALDPAALAALQAEYELVAVMISQLIARTLGSRLTIPEGTLDALDRMVADLETEAARLGLHNGEGA